MLQTFKPTAILSRFEERNCYFLQLPRCLTLYCSLHTEVCRTGCGEGAWTDGAADSDIHRISVLMWASNPNISIESQLWWAVRDIQSNNFRRVDPEHPQVSARYWQHQFYLLRSVSVVYVKPLFEISIEISIGISTKISIEITTKISIETSIEIGQVNIDNVRHTSSEQM